MGIAYRHFTVACARWRVTRLARATRDEDAIDHRGKRTEALQITAYNAEHAMKTERRMPEQCVSEFGEPNAVTGV